MSTTYHETPPDLPVPQDDGSCAHLAGLPLPSITLESTSGLDVSLASLPEKVILFIYPATGTPGVPLPEGWNEIPGARGCTPESLAFKSSFDAITKQGYTVYGISAQSVAEQREARVRLELPYELLSDRDFQLADSLKLPTFRTKNGTRYLQRCTLVAESREIRHVIFPVFPTNEAANMVLRVIRTS